jgi:uncharacterized protein YraI
MRQRKLRAILFSAVLLLCASRGAAADFLSTSYSMYAGPGITYPVVAHPEDGAHVNIFGCLPDWNWCDVSYGPYRGWIPASNLWGPYRHRRTNVMHYGPQTGVPIVVFEEKSYWNNHYRNQPFYNRRIYWNDHRDHHGWNR